MTALPNNVTHCNVQTLVSHSQIVLMFGITIELRARNQFDVVDVLITRLVDASSMVRLYVRVCPRKPRLSQRISCQPDYEQRSRIHIGTRLDHRPLERKNLGEEENSTNHQRGTHGVERGPPWISLVSPSEDQADEQAQHA